MRANRLLKRLSFAILLALWASSTSVPGAEMEGKASFRTKPNIIYLFADQMRFSAMSCMRGVPGADSDSQNINTPNLDRLASSGVLFTHAFSSSPVCSPYRTGLQTGKYSHTTSFKLHPNETTLPMCLKREGYSTAYIGKWHMTPSASQDEQEGGPAQYVPEEVRKGWDYFAGQEVSHAYFGPKAGYFLNQNKEPIHLKDGEYEPTVQTDLAIAYIRKSKGSPFLLMVAYGPPHNPYEPPQHIKRIPDQAVKLNPNVPEEYRHAAQAVLPNYYAQIVSLDIEVGRVLDALDQTGLRDNTIVWFSSDHGDMLYSHEDQNEGRAPGMKRRPWNEAARIPGIISWPAQIQPGQRRDMLFASVNYMPTLLGFAGVPPPAGVQGRDLSPAILRDAAEEEDAVFIEQIAPGHTPYLAPWRAIRTKRYLYAQSGHLEKGDWLLYDVQEDPYQSKNLVGDPSRATDLNRLKQMLAAWKEKTGDTQDLRAEYLSKKQRKRREE